MVKVTRTAPTSDESILVAALDRFEVLGIGRTTADDIAKQAGVDRTTLYRRIGNKDAIVRAALLFEAHRTFARIQRRISELDTYESQIVDGFAITVLMLRKHPLLRRILRVERGEILTHLTVNAEPVLTLATEMVMGLHAASRERFDIAARPQDADAAALFMRVIHSLLIVPDAPPRLTTHEQLRAFADVHVKPSLLAPPVG